MGSWQMLTKHITQGMCIRIKEAIGRGVDIEACFRLSRRKRSKTLLRGQLGMAVRHFKE